MTPMRIAICDDEAFMRSQLAEQVGGFLRQAGVVEDLDWCVLFGNALDNALAACGQAERSFLRIDCKGQGDFYMLEFVNGCKPEISLEPGCGLENMRAVAEKYHGTAQCSWERGEFRLAILLNLSLPPKKK